MVGHRPSQSTSSTHSLPLKYQTSPFPPNIHRRITVSTTSRGLVISGQASSLAIFVEHGVKGRVISVDDPEHGPVPVDFGGILGLVRLWDASYLLLFPATQSTQLYPGSTVSFTVLPNIISIPMQHDLATTVLASQRPNGSHSLSWRLLSNYTETGSTAPAGDDLIAPEADDSPMVPPPGSSNRWARFVPRLTSAAADNATENTPSSRRDLQDKVIKQIVREFSSGSFFYSQDGDLTRTLQHKQSLLSSKRKTDAALSDLLGGSRFDNDVHVPLWRRVDRRFFWNEWMMREFVEAGLHSFVTPVIQGYIHSTCLPVDNSPALILISRRSRDRAGLRYQRRGIDDAGHVANMVETEMIVHAEVESKTSLFSFVQIRGSIPLKWSQSPFSMKPPPVLDQPVDQTFSTANIHFEDLSRQYGPITIINLSEQTGKESAVTVGYRELVGHLDKNKPQYIEFDFHAKCRGMKWEHISELVERADVKAMGHFWCLQNDTLVTQNGVFRTNCIDCLDRTNVVQSAFARKVLNEMLTQIGIMGEGSGIESSFNETWANNGDMISLCYAHTSALKGDFVRTGKRDVRGMFNDGISSVTRMFYGAVSDFFSQAVISFFLGHRNLGVFNEFVETLATSDASSLEKFARVRTAAIETSSARVLEDGEHRAGGWTLLSPAERNTTISTALEEKILLLSAAAVYIVSFNFSLEKVVDYIRIPLDSIIEVQKGAYILSTLQEASRDPSENAGLIIRFSSEKETCRYSSYSLRNTVNENLIQDVSSKTDFYAFKSLPREYDDHVDVHLTCQSAIDHIASRIENECGREVVVDRDIVSLEEAQKATSILAKMDYAVKRFLWL